MVQATIATAISSATNASRKNHTILSGSRRSLFTQLACATAALLIVAGCATSPPAAPSLPAKYAPVAWSALPGWTEDSVSEIWPAFRAGCAALVAAPSTRALWETPCARSNGVIGTDRNSVRAFFERHFSPYQVTAADGRDTGLITGYYEPLLAGSRLRTAQYHVPLYGAPDDLLTVDLTELYPELKDKRLRGRMEGKRVIPYWTRADIESGKAPVNGMRELVYVDDPVEAFFLQIQGSGRVRLAEGGVMRVGYADQNGYPFRSIGRILIERGELTLDRASMQGIKEWGRRNPEKLPALLNENPSYIFFREVPPPAPGTLEADIDGPIGTLGVPLLRERTLAADPRSIPLGAPVFLATTYPLSSRPLTRLMMAQDTGGAIRGAVRADFYWGFGDDAGRQAGRMRQDGRMWILWPANAGEPPGGG
jgi:membrane-bound lytic murein transglycosylase A